MSKSNKIRVLLAEDSEQDALLIRNVLAKQWNDLAVKRVETAETLRAALEEGTWNVVLSDCVIPGFGARGVLEIVSQSGLDLPVIAVSGAVGEEEAVSLMRAGARDYVSKDNLARLVPAIERELREAKARRKRRQAERDLRESQRALHEVIDAVPAMINAKDRQSCYIFMNRYQAEFYGVRPKEAVGRTASELLGKEYGEYTKALDRRVFASGSALANFEENWTDVDGNPHILLTTKAPLHDEQGAVVNVVTVALDIGARKLAEEALREALDKYQGLFDNAQTGITRNRLDDGKALEANERMAQIYGYESRQQYLDEFVAIERYVEPGVRERLLELLGEDGAVENFEAQVTRRDGSPMWVRFSSRAYPEKGYLESVVLDVTKEKEIETALRDAKEAAEVANRAKTEFLANMSHELRTPLNSVIGFSDILVGEAFGPIDNPRYKEYIRDINEAGKHLLDLINDILDVSRIETGTLTFVDDDIDIAQLIHSIARLIRDRVEKAGLTLITDTPKSLPALHADESKVKQILLNLLSNAVKFTPEGGTVTLKAEMDPQERLTFIISDTGIGIAPEDVEGVLSTFGQANGSLTRKYDGAGLGLPLSRKLVELHGGELTLETALGVGTTVTVRFPWKRVVRTPPSPAGS